MVPGAAKLALLPLESLIKTGGVDHADWNYKPVLRTISRSRFRLVKKMLGDKYVEHLLEIGYGSGVFFPELTKHAGNLFGVDIHTKADEVNKKLKEAKINAQLISEGAENMTFHSDSMDLVIAISTLSFVHDLNAVCCEVKRVLKPTGSFLIVTPGKSPLIDFGLKVLTGISAEADFSNRREEILPTLRDHFRVKQELTYPRHGAGLIRLYTALELTLP